MYVGKQKFKRNSIPEVDRNLEFSDNDFWEKETENSANFYTRQLVESLADENLLFLYPIVRYMPSNTIYFNKFVESIVVAIAGRKHVSASKLENVITKIKVFLVKPKGEVTVLCNCEEELFQFLCKKPRLCVSKEGVLIFYNDKKIMATIDMDGCNSVNVEELAEALNQEITQIRELTTDSNADIHINFSGNGEIDYSRDFILKTNFSFIDEIGVTLEIDPVSNDTAETTEKKVQPESETNQKEKLKQNVFNYAAGVKKEEQDIVPTIPLV